MYALSHSSLDFVSSSYATLYQTPLRIPFQRPSYAVQSISLMQPATMFPSQRNAISHNLIYSHHTQHHKLNWSKLNRSILLCLLMTPNLKYFSSPPAVLPPIYHFSAPTTSLNPSEELSLPLLPLVVPRYLAAAVVFWVCVCVCGPYIGNPPPQLSLGDVPGDVDKGEVERARGEWSDVRAVLVGPPVWCFVDVDIERGWEGCGCDEEWEWVCEDVWEDVTTEEDDAEVAFPVWNAERARKAARKLERKGRCVDMFAVGVCMWCVLIEKRRTSLSWRRGNSWVERCSFCGVYRSEGRRFDILGLKPLTRNELSRRPYWRFWGNAGTTLFALLCSLLQKPLMLLIFHPAVVIRWFGKHVVSSLVCAL